MKSIKSAVAFIVVILFITSICTIALAEEQGNHVADYPNYALEYSGHKYTLFDVPGLTWKQAEEICEAYGGYLVCINSKEEQAQIETLLSNGKLGMYWIGGYRTGTDVFAWMDGSEMKYTNWDLGKADNYLGVEDYIQIFRVPNPKVKKSKANKWNDAPDDNTIDGEDFFTKENVGFIMEGECAYNADWEPDLSDYIGSAQNPALALLQAPHEYGDLITFGRYEQDDVLSNGQEPIYWLIVDKDDESITMISLYGLDKVKYNNVITSVTWESCSLRHWLNNEFLETAFTKEEQAMLKTVNVPTEKNDVEGKIYVPDADDADQGNDTQDKVFLLSIDELNRYFNLDEENLNDSINDDGGVLASICYPSEYIDNCGIYRLRYTGGTSWWLRQAGENNYTAVFVNGWGYAEPHGTAIDDDGVLVRPVVVLHLGDPDADK